MKEDKEHNVYGVGATDAEGRKQFGRRYGKEN
jgi:hypothetical protein